MEAASCNTSSRIRAWRAPNVKAAVVHGLRTPEILLFPSRLPPALLAFRFHISAGSYVSSCPSNPLRSSKHNSGASLVAQWLEIRLPMQGTRVRALVWEDPTCRGAAGPASHSYWACASGACAPRQERPRQWEARAPRWRVAPARRN